MVASGEHFPSEFMEDAPIFSPLSYTASVSPLGTPPLEAKFHPFAPYDRQIDNVIFDLRGVLLTWSANTNTSISPQSLRSILRSSTWFEYEKGNLCEEEAYGLAATEFSLGASEVGAVRFVQPKPETPSE